MNKISQHKDAIGSTDTLDLPGVPRCYYNIKQVFRRSQASSLPPHRPLDCVIDQLPWGASLEEDYTPCPPLSAGSQRNILPHPY